MGNSIDIFDSKYLGITALVTLGYQLTFFFITWTFKFDTVTDLAGGSNFVLVALLALFLKQTFYIRQLVLTSAVVIWGTRLSGFLFYRIIVWGEDRRFDEHRKNFGQLAAFWTFQFLWVWVVTLPVTLVNSNPNDFALGLLDYIGWTMWALGFAFEAVADQQKFYFKQDPSNRGKWCAVGVWGWSRHPNYFGEIMLWGGVYLSSLSTLSGWTHVAICSPLFISCLLLFLSGIPLLEKSADERYGSPEHALHEEYLEYKDSTSPLIPWPQSSWKHLPRLLKAILFEFPIYSSHLSLANPADDVEPSITRPISVAAQQDY